MNNYYSYDKPQFKDGTIPPVVIKLGKKKKKQIKKLKKGRGPIVNKVFRNVEMIRMRLGSEELNNKTLIPFVLLVKEKERKKKKKRHGKLSRLIAESQAQNILRNSGLNPLASSFRPAAPAPTPNVSKQTSTEPASSEETQ